MTYQLQIQINTFVYYQMSEIQSNQQEEAVKIQQQPSETHSLPETHPEKIEETVALEVSQLADSSLASSVASHQNQSQISHASPPESQLTQPLETSSEKVQETVTLVTSVIQEQSTVSEPAVEQARPEPVKVEPSPPETQQPIEKPQEKVEVAPQIEPLKIGESSNESGNAPAEIQSKSNPNPPALLSPRQSTRRSASPAISRGKLETVNKMLTKEEDKNRDLEAKLNDLTKKKLELEKSLNEKLLTQKTVKEKQEEEQRINQEKAALKKTIDEKKEELHRLKERKAKEQADHAAELERIKGQNKRLQEEIQAKRLSDHSKKLEYEANVANTKAVLQAEKERLTIVQGEHRGVQSKREEIVKKIADLNNAKKVAQQKLTHTQQQKEEQAKAQQKAKESILKKIAEVKDKINSKKQELTQVRSHNHDDLKAEHEKILGEVTRVQALSQQLTVTNKKLEEDIVKKSKENIENKQLEKKKEKRIIDLTKRSEELTKRASQFKDEIAKLDSQKQQKKVVRYEQKVPEELLAIQAKNEALKKEIKKINERYEAEKAEMDKLVPPSVIENMNKKITAVIATNEKLTEVSKIIEDVTKENEKLAVEMDHLEWGENNRLKDLQNEKKKQEEKNKALEEELQAKKKQLQQLNSKLEQYVKEYPDFKPEKKKKPEPQPEPKPKKEEKTGKKNDKSPPAEESKKKKGNVDPVIEPKVEQVKVQEPKPAGKNKKKKGNSSSEVIQAKDPSPPPVEIKVQKNKVEVKPEARSEIRVEKKLEEKPEPKSEIKQVQKVEAKPEGKKSKNKKK